MRHLSWLAVSLFCLALPVRAGMARASAAPAARHDGAQVGQRLELREVGAWPYGPSRAVACDPARQLLFSAAARLVQCYCLSNPAKPIKVGPELCASGLVTRLCYDAGARKLYVAGSDGTLEIWDVREPETPRRLGSAKLPGAVYGLDLGGPYLYCAIPEPASLAILEVFEPSFPREVGRLELESEPNAVVVSGGIAYVGAYGAVEVVDVSNPSSPRRMSIYDEEGEDVMDMELRGWLLYMATDYGVSIVDVSDPYALELVAYTEDWDMDYALAIELSGWYAFVADEAGHLAAVDVSNPALPVVIAWLTVPGEVAYDVCLAGNIACLAAGDDGVVIADVTRPAGPQILSQFGAPDRFYDAVAAESGFVYLWLYDTLEVWNLLDPRAPWRSGRCELVVTEPDDAVARDGYLYWSSGNLCIADVSNPASPRVLSDACELAGERFDVAGDFLYCASEEEWLYLYDLRDKSNPQYSGHVSIGGAVLDVSIAGRLCCVAAEDEGLVVLDISDPFNPAELGREATYAVEQVVVCGRYAYCLGDDAALLVFDLADPAQPQMVGSYYSDELDTDARFATDGRYVFYPDEDEAMGLFVIDVTDPTQPKEVARALTPFYPYAAAVDRGVVYVATEERAILALDATSPVGLHEVGRTPGWDAANAVAASRGRMYVAAGNTGLVTLDATQLPLTEVGRLDTLGFMRSLAVSGDRAYLLNASSLTVADISDAGLNVRGQVYLPKYGRGLEVAGDYVYVADHSAGLVIVDVSDPSRPYIAGSIAKPRRAYGVAAKGNIVYGCSYETSSRRYAVFAFDVSDPSRPQVLDSCGVWRRAYDVALKDTFLYVACGTNGCQVVSVSDPAHPQPVAGFGTRDYRQLCVRGQYLFAAGDETGLQVFDLSSPASPELVAQYDTPGSALGVCVQGHYVYLADGPAGALMLGLNLVWARTDTVTRPALRVLENPTRQTQLAGVLELVEAADITLAVYSAAGRRVAGEHLVAAGPGRHHFHLNLAGVPAGAYFLRATGAARLPTVKFVLAR